MQTQKIAFKTFGINRKYRNARCGKTALAMFTQAKAQAAGEFASFAPNQQYEDVYAAAYEAPQLAGAQAEQQDAQAALNMAENADPMVAFVAATVEMQQKQTEQLRRAAEEQSAQRKETLATMQRSLRLASTFRKKQLSKIEGDMAGRRAVEGKQFSAFAEAQKKLLKSALESHTKNEQTRLTKFQNMTTEASKKQGAQQENQFTRSIGRVNATLQKHGKGLASMAEGLKQQQQVTQSLKTAIEQKAAAAVGQKESAVKQTVSAINSLGNDLKKEQAKTTVVVASTIQRRANGQLQSVRAALKEHGDHQTRAMSAEFKKQQTAQIQGLKAAVTHQKAQQQNQLTQLRDALEARRRLAAGAQSPVLSGRLGQVKSLSS